MKVTDIRIESFGVWRDLDLSLSRSGVNVFFGPNEAGKTTLMRFIRGVLYGFPPFERRRGMPAGVRSVAQGALTVEHAGTRCVLSRSADAGERGALSISGLETNEPAAHVLAEMLQGTQQTIFDNVFAIGLQELQELATLHDDEVADHIYGLTLGPEGKRLLEASTGIEEESSRLLHDDASRGVLADLLRRDSELSSAIQAESENQELYLAGLRELDKLTSKISNLKSRQGGMHSQLRGHLFLDRVWTPWSQVRDYQRQLDQVPVVASFPEDGLARLEELESELATATRCRNALKTEAAEFRRQGEALRLDPAIEEHAASIHNLVDQRDVIARLGEIVAKHRTGIGAARGQLDGKLGVLGSDWSEERLEGIDVAPSAQFKLLSAARSYQKARTRRARLRGRYERLAKSFRQQSADLQDRVKSLKGSSLDDAVTAEKQRLADLGELGRLGIAQTELESRAQSLQSSIEQEDQRRVIPMWVYVVWGLFGACGLLLVGLGVSTGMTTSLVGGLGYAFLGVTCAIMGWGLKSHHSIANHDHRDEWEDELAQVEAELRETNQAIARIAGEPFGPAPTPSVFPPARATEAKPDTGALIAKSARRLAELEGWANRQQRLASTRRRLSELRQRFKEMQRDVTEARQTWCSALGELGLPETVKIDEAFANWQNVSEAADARNRWLSARSHLEDHQSLYDAYCLRIAELAEQTGGEAAELDDPLAALSVWERELDAYRRTRSERQRLRKEEKRRKREVEEYEKQVDQLTAQRSALFVQGGANNREEFERRAGWVSTRQELEGYLSIAQSEVESAARTEPDLAVVEEDLHEYDAEENNECVAALKLELAELEQDLQDAHEQLGSVKQEVRRLEESRVATQLRFDHAQNQCQLKQACEQWFAAQIGRHAVEQIRSRFERECQPSVLASASRYLQRMTRGRYTNVWTPLGQRRLQVEDQQGRTFSPEQLSGGTREQLFLAIRLAFIREFSRRGVELPVVLDDILVNFDQPRTEATVETLLEFAAESQQMLFFTCHLHLAQLFESKGSQTIWLPSNVPATPERIAG